MWKLLTGIIGESVCSHLEEEQLLPPDQKGGRKGCKGTKNQLLAYFYQCQGIVNILGLQWIDFVVYTDVDMYVERIHKDTNLWKRTMLPKLPSFYLTFVLPEV